MAILWMATSQKQVINRLYIAVFVKNLSWACYFASVYAAMSLLKLFQVQGINPKCESVKTSDCMLLTYKIKKKVFVGYLL